MIRLISFISIGFHVLFLTMGYTTADLGKLAVVPVVFGSCWTASVLRRWFLPDPIIISLVFLFTVFGLLNNASPVPMIMGFIAGLIAWDLNRFHRYLLSVDERRSKHLIIKRYLYQLAGVSAASASIAILALQIDIQLNLYLTVLLVCVLLFLKPGSGS